MNHKNYVLFGIFFLACACTIWPMSDGEGSELVMQQEERIEKEQGVVVKERKQLQSEKLSRRFQEVKVRLKVSREKRLRHEAEVLEQEKIQKTRQARRRTFQKAAREIGEGVRQSKLHRKLSHKTFGDWHAAVQTVTPNVILEETKESPTVIIPMADMKLLLNSYFENMHDIFDQTDWVGSKPDESFFAREYSLHPNGIIFHNYRPFVQKLIVEPGAVFAIFGDLHGDIFSPMAALKFLKDKGWIDDHFKVIKKNFYILFLGDYTDRGNYGLECVYTILRLHAMNPDRVVLIRGNHEDVSLTAEHGFMKEIAVKYGGKDSSAEFMEEEDPAAGLFASHAVGASGAVALLRDIHRMYDFMPVALYLGIPETECIVNYIQCCHGGMEQGYFPQTLLESSYDRACELLPASLSTQDRLKGKEFDRLPAEFHKARFIRNSYMSIGFLWNDFFVDPNEKTQYIKNRGWSFGKNTTKVLLHEQSSQKANIRGVFRAHQHGDIQFPMMGSIYDTGNKTPQHKGISKLWKAEDEHGFNSDLLWDGIVVTFSVGPDNGKFNPIAKGLPLKFHAFGILTTSPEFKDWKLETFRLDFPDQIIKASWIISKQAQ